MDILKQRKKAGGFRPGAGRPKLTITQQRVKQVTATLKKYAKEQGKTLDEIACDMAYGLDVFRDISAMMRLKAIVFLDDRTRVAEGGEADHAFPGPVFYDLENPPKDTGAPVYLPITKPDPAKVVPLDTGDVE